MAYSEPWKFDGTYIALRYFVMCIGNSSWLWLVFVKRSFLDYFRCLAGLWIPPSIYKCYVTGKVILGSVCFMQIEAYWSIIQDHIHTYSEPSLSLVYSEPGNIQKIIDICQTYCSVFGKEFQATTTFAGRSFLDHFRYLAGL